MILSPNVILKETFSIFVRHRPPGIFPLTDRSLFPNDVTVLSRLFTSNTRIRVLLKLFLNPGVSAYLRELAAEFAVAPSTLKGELDSLSQAGYLERNKNGRSIYFKANTEHPFFPELHSMVKKTFGIDQIIERVHKELGRVDGVYVVGDYAQGIDSGIIELTIVGTVSSDALKRYVGITEATIERRLLVEVMEPVDFARESGMHPERPCWRVV